MTSGVARFGRYRGPPAVEDLDRFFFLDDADRALVSKLRGDHLRLGLASQLVTVRYLGTFLVDALDVPHVVVEYRVLAAEEQTAALRPRANRWRVLTIHRSCERSLRTDIHDH